MLLASALAAKLVREKGIAAAGVDDKLRVPDSRPAFAIFRVDQ